MTAPTRCVDSVPSFVTDYAPILRLHTQEIYNPCDIGTHLSHTVPEVNRVVVRKESCTLDDLDQMNRLGGETVCLTSREGIAALPSWFRGIKPEQDGVVRNAKTAIVVVVDKPNVDGGVTDVFYFYFYSYNQGNSVNFLWINLGEFGDHVGDWEYNMIRFKNGRPQAVWFSQHAFGEAYTYDAVEKQGHRPLAYVGLGTHANWATSGPHDHTLQVINLPFKGVVTDYTDAGPLYDPIASSYFYKYDLSSGMFSAFDSSPVNWLNYDGLWGDQQLPSNAPGQRGAFGIYKYVSGPNGPKFKDLDRSSVCSKDVIVCVVNSYVMS